MIDINKLVKSFEEIVGWKYESPGNYTKNGIDCSGAFVRAYRAQKQNIYHGSNRIIRVHTNGVFLIQSTEQLRVGMAVFKQRENTDRLHQDYKPGGRFYNPDLPFDYYHIGLVVSDSPLRIIHATPPVAKVDTKLGQWKLAGYLSAANYEGFVPDIPILTPDSVKPSVSPKNEITLYNGFASNFPPNETLNFRRIPNGGVIDKVKYGEVLEVLEDTSPWSKVRYNGKVGYVMNKFITRDLLVTEKELTLEEKIIYLEQRIFELERLIRR